MDSMETRSLLRAPLSPGFGGPRRKAPVHSVLPLCVCQGTADGCFCRLFYSPWNTSRVGLLCSALLGVTSGLGLWGCLERRGAPLPLPQHPACQRSPPPKESLPLSDSCQWGCWHCSCYFPGEHSHAGHSRLSFRVSLRVLSCPPCLSVSCV